LKRSTCKNAPMPKALVSFFSRFKGKTIEVREPRQTNEARELRSGNIGVRKEVRVEWQESRTQRRA
jgi:hypothetical protein